MLHDGKYECKMNKNYSRRAIRVLILDLYFAVKMTIVFFFFFL